jgi:hypothetical protein
LQYFGDDRYEIEGFTTAEKAKSQDIDYLLLPNSGKPFALSTSRKNSSVCLTLGGQPALNLIDANHILIQVSKLLCLMLSYEETQRTMGNESKRQQVSFLLSSKPRKPFLF